MEVHAKTDAMIAALRSWQAMLRTEDMETRAALWRCAVKYARKAREDALRLEIQRTLAADAQTIVGGLVSLREEVCR